MLVHQFNKLHRTQHRISARLFSCSVSSKRDKNVVYNIEDRPNPVLDEDFRTRLRDGYKIKKSDQAIAPSQEFTQNVNYVFNHGEKVQ